MLFVIVPISVYLLPGAHRQPEGGRGLPPVLRGVQLGQADRARGHPGSGAAHPGHHRPADHLRGPAPPQARAQRQLHPGRAQGLRGQEGGGGDRDE